MTWQPIETAPIGKRVIIGGGSVVRLGTKDTLGMWRNYMGRPLNASPTHWMPIPNPPDFDDEKRAA